MSSNLQVTPLNGYQQAQTPRYTTMSTTDSYDTITTAGYLDSNPNAKLLTKDDFIFAKYATHSVGIFTVAIADSGQITLNPYVGEGNVEQPTVAGNFPKFVDTEGRMLDSGISPTDVTKTKAVMQNGAAVVGNSPRYSDVSGTIVDSGAKQICGVTSTYAGGGTSNAFTVAGLTTSSIVLAQIKTSTNSVSVTKAVPTTNTLTVTFSADPGASTVLNYFASSAGLT